jgi:phenylpropionate dioxygenase-like ring-hydroxylating dioxygenase large terminal subunit
MIEGNLSSFSMPAGDLSHVPFRVYTDQDIYKLEQKHIFRGPTWNFLALECEIPNVGDYKTTYLGDAPVIVVLGPDES